MRQSREENIIKLILEKNDLIYVEKYIKQYTEYKMNS